MRTLVLVSLLIFATTAEAALIVGEITATYEGRWGMEPYDHSKYRLRLQTFADEPLLITNARMYGQNVGTIQGSVTASGGGQLTGFTGSLGVDSFLVGGVRYNTYVGAPIYTGVSYFPVVGDWVYVYTEAATISNPEPSLTLAVAGVAGLILWKKSKRGGA